MSAAEDRERLVQHLARQGIVDERVLAAIGRTPREEFVADAQQEHAYEDRALPLSSGQTISQPYIVALMSQALELKGDETILEIGTGSGYQAAILAQLCAQVVSIERLPDLAERAIATLTRLGFGNVDVLVGDGTLGARDHGPYDGIIITASGPVIPPSLPAQLKPDGRLVMPIGDANRQDLIVARNSPAGLQIRELCPCSFVRLVGAEGWSNGD